MLDLANTEPGGSTVKAFFPFSLTAIVILGFSFQLRAQQQDQVAGNMVLFMENGGWCWYQDERILVDTAAGTLVFHAIQNYMGTGGKPADGDVLVGSLDLNSRKRTLFHLADVPSFNSGDDHNVGALWIRPDGRYFAAYAGHNDEGDAARMRISSQPRSITSWRSEFKFNWTTAGGKDGNVTYNNVHFLANEGTGSGRLYNITRQWERSPIFGYSDDWGDTWKYGGALSLPVSGRGYSNGYYKYANNGTDRIDFIMTEAHPRDFNTSIFHGYLLKGKTYNTQGTVIDSDIFDQTAPDPQAFTRVFSSSPEDNNNDASEYHRAWTVDLERIGGSLYALFTTRYGTQVSADKPGDADHRLFYAKLENSQGNWTYKELCKMGVPLDPREQDYTGLGTIDPKNPNVVYVSTPINPSTNAATPHWEIYRGESSNNGSSWNWTAITSNSSADNFRPIIPSWDAKNRAVLWLRGEYIWQHEHDQSVVGMVHPANETVGSMTYVDASASNTTLSDGGTLNATGPGSGMGSNDQQWHWRTGYGNGGSILASAEGG
jgi:hypothetical protein